MSRSRWSVVSSITFGIGTPPVKRMPKLTPISRTSFGTAVVCLFQGSRAFPVWFSAFATLMRHFNVPEVWRDRFDPHMRAFPKDNARHLEVAG